MLIRGESLNVAQRRLVLAAFIYRWTHENARLNYGSRCPACVQRFQCDSDATKDINGVPWHDYHVPLTNDEEWVRRHAFHFTKDGLRLSSKKHERHAEPAYLARPESSV